MTTALKLHFLLAVSIILISSCTTEETANIKVSSKNSSGFNFETTAETAINIAIKGYDNAPMAGVTLEIYASNPYDKNGLTIKQDAALCLKGMTNESGLYSTSFSFPNNLDSVYVRVKSACFKEINVFKKTANLSKTFLPLGYGIMKSSTFRAATDPMLYSKNTTRLPVSSNLWVLGTYSASNGVPNFLLPSNMVIPTDLLTRINTSLPEGDGNPSKYLTTTHPQWFLNDGATNISFIAEAHAWITFVGEGAGVNNTLAYFYYPTNSPPTSAAQIAKRIIIFPNSSANGSGGGLVAGNTVLLKYYDEATSTWKETFPAGITVSWFLATNGWMDNSEYGYILRNNTVNQYSLDHLNNGAKNQSIMLFDSEYQELILGFEDISCADVAGVGKDPSDQDFNDVLYIVRTDPVNAVDLPKFNKLSDADDNDHDGVPNQNDDYPNDPLRAYNNYYPNASTFGSLAFEDNWPNKGDYDFNDLVLDYRIMYVTNAAGAVKDVVPTIKVKAIGAEYRNGFAFELNGNPSNVESVTQTYSGPGTLLGGLFNLNANGCEAGQAKIVVPFFDNAFTSYGSSFIAGFPNTVVGSTYYNPIMITKKITFTTPVSVASLGSAPYNPFLVVNQSRGREIHKPGKSATSLADVSLFNTSEDLTNQSNLWYVGPQDYPWVIDTPIPFEYPSEGNRIETAYLKVSDWVTSSGNAFADWFSNLGAGYRNTNMIYRRN